MKKMVVADVIKLLEEFAPPNLAPFDYVGLLQGNHAQRVTKIGLTLDYSLLAIERAIEANCDFLIVHHGPTEIHYPLTGNNLQKISFAAKHQLSVYRCHLNLDFCEGGIIDSLCDILKIPSSKAITSYQGRSLIGGVNLSKEYPISLEELISRVQVLGNSHVRVAGRKRTRFSRIAITSGQGFISEFFDQLKPDLYIAGEFEQEATKYAEDLGITLLELGHHFSEQSTFPIIANKLSKQLKIPVIDLEVEDTIQVISLISK